MDRFGYMTPGRQECLRAQQRSSQHAESKYVFTCMNTDKISHVYRHGRRMHSIKVADIPPRCDSGIRAHLQII